MNHQMKLQCIDTWHWLRSVKYHQWNILTLVFSTWAEERTLFLEDGVWGCAEFGPKGNGFHHISLSHSVKTFGTSTCFFLPSLRLIRNFKNVLHFHTDKTGLSDSFEHKGPFLDACVCVCDGFCATETSRTLFFLWAARLWCSASLLSGACQG